MALEPGKKAPAFALANEAGEKVKLSDFKGRRLVLFFFPKAGTSG
jgi:peroxiredoxin Q/BCP